MASIEQRNKARIVARLWRGLTSTNSRIGRNLHGIQEPRHATTCPRNAAYLDLRNGVYGFVGMADRTMYPIIRPGSIVQIDQNQRKISSIKWQNEHERPIYFIELRGEYICSWCEMREGHLSAVPHPNSKCEVRRFSYPREAEIVGRVVGVTMRLAETG